MREFYPKYALLIGLNLLAFSLFGQSNLYLHFDGQDDYTAFPGASQYLYGSNTITMAGWFYTDALVYGQGMMSIRGGGSGDGQMYVLQLSNGTLECRLITNTGLHEVVGPAGSIVAGQWQHIAWVFDINAVRLYIDGNLIGSSFASGSFRSNDRPFSIGKSLLAGYNFIYGGRADEVSLWNKALTQAEIQDMMANELAGTETDLVVYYKFDQGAPEGDNRSITQLNAYGGLTDRNSNLYNFALNGSNSNFAGTLEPGFQTISIPPVSNKLTTDGPFDLGATASSGLPVLLEVLSGPASVNGDSVVLDGISGEVIIRASQAGDGSFDPAEDAYVSFEVLNPAEVLPEVEVLHPLAGAVYAPKLTPLQIGVSATIDHPELFDIDELTATIEGETVSLKDHGNGFFTAWWSPPRHGVYTVEVSAANNFGFQADTSYDIALLPTTTNKSVRAIDSAWVYIEVSSVTVEAELPSHIGAFTEIMGHLTIECPNGDCDPWDRVSSIEVQGKDGQWFQIIRYLTPYGVACESDIDLTDFKSLLIGKTKFRVNLTTYANGFLYSLDLDYTGGQDSLPYSHVEKLWYESYPFGDMANLQPTDTLSMEFPPNTSAAKLKLVSTGHGWGENNTDNAAEFLRNTHHIWVNGTQTFTQDNWYDCDPNPDGCQPQSGTWYFNRAGWCPGSIAQFFDYDMTPYVGQPVDMSYVFDEGYVDRCHRNNPNCESGVTCPNCNDSFNPHLIVSSYMVSFGDTLLEELTNTSLADPIAGQVSVYPNPSNGQFYVEVPQSVQMTSIQVANYDGRILQTQPVGAYHYTARVDLGQQPAGVYFVTINSHNHEPITKRVIVE